MSTRKSLFFSFLDRYASLAIAIGSSMVIARLLTPTEIGVFSVTMVLLTFVSTLRDMGAGQYLVQEKELTTDRIRAVWAVQLGLGLALALVVLAGSYPVSLFYDEPRMFTILLVVALNYAVNPFGSLTYAWLMREMRFESLALMRFASSVTGAVVSIGLAWRGFGPISLAYGSLGSTLVNAGIAVYYRPASFPWLPGTSEIRRVLSFGSKLSLSTLLHDLAVSAPELFMGKLQSLTAAGYYSRANGLVQMFYRLFVDAVSTVCMPWFAKQAREHGGFAEPFLKATAYVTALGWSFCLAVVCLAHPMINLLYGNQWNQAVDLTRLLAVAMAFSVPAALCYAALLASGAATDIAKVIGINAITTVVLVALGAHFGLLGIGVSAIAAAAIGSLVMLRTTLAKIGLTWRALALTSRPSAGVASLAALGPVLALWQYGLNSDEIAAPLFLGGTLGLFGFVSGIYVFKHPLRQELSNLRQTNIAGWLNNAHDHDQ